MERVSATDDATVQSQNMVSRRSRKVGAARLRRYRREASALTGPYTADRVTVVDGPTLKRAAGGASLGNMME